MKRIVILICLCCMGYLSARAELAHVTVNDKYSAEEIALVEDAFKDNGLADNRYLQLLVYAIGVAEGRRTDKYQFGIKHPRCSKTDFREQAGWCAATVKKRFEAFHSNRHLKKSTTFFNHLATIYCPPIKDPVGHRNWKKNVSHWYERFNKNSLLQVQASGNTANE